MNEKVSAVIGYGSALAMVISYTANKSIGWAIFHGFLSWFFVLYASVTYP